MTPHFSAEHRAVWRKLAFTRLRQISSHRLSIWLLLGVSAALFLTVLFIALPSAQVRVWPRVSLVTHTANVLLVASGASLPATRQNVLLLLPIDVSVEHALTFDQVSRNFLGKNAEVEMTMVNESSEPYTFRGGTRLVNQAGMIFRTLAPVVIPAAALVEPGIATVRARAAPEDLYGQIIGERGNVPEGLKWEFPGLSLEERKKVYARNLKAATGGTTAYGNLLKQEDLDLAEKQLTQELLRAAKARADEELETLRGRTGKQYVVLQYDVLTRAHFSGGTLPTELIGAPVSSIPVEGSLHYTVLAYSKDDLRTLLLPGLRDHIEEGQGLVEGSVSLDGISVHVIEYDDNFQWVKVTAELTGKQRSVLAPNSATGRIFGEKLREAIKGKTVEEAKRIIQNFPEVDHVEVSMWPPWQPSLPPLTSNILLLPQGE